MADILSQYPELRSLRDKLLVIDTDAKRIGEAVLTKFLLASAIESPLPADRLLDTKSAAALVGVATEDFHEWASLENLLPVRRLSRTSYWRAGDLYQALKRR
jgi:hypothetical protein